MNYFLDAEKFGGSLWVLTRTPRPPVAFVLWSMQTLPLPAPPRDTLAAPNLTSESSKQIWIPDLRTEGNGVALTATEARSGTTTASTTTLAEAAGRRNGIGRTLSGTKKNLQMKRGNTRIRGPRSDKGMRTRGVGPTNRQTQTRGFGVKVTIERLFKETKPKGASNLCWEKKHSRLNSAFRDSKTKGSKTKNGVMNIGCNKTEKFARESQRSDARCKWTKWKGKENRESLKKI